ncbi:uncharacterized protein LOC106013206 [Aplysia californica]|uniref:Uncharacterized protein LOC106013206 n=1 Tax=Aplysia californica TaxID=6500 RepID=A0ABM1AA48_APLCA|nr:uncharacterized protein LOC106013206 [Aplysia californica]
MSNAGGAAGRGVQQLNDLDGRLCNNCESQDQVPEGEDVSSIVKRNCDVERDKVTVCDSCTEARSEDIGGPDETRSCRELMLAHASSSTRVDDTSSTKGPAEGASPDAKAYCDKDSRSIEGRDGQELCSDLEWTDCIVSDGNDDDELSENCDSTGASVSQNGVTAVNNAAPFDRLCTAGVSIRGSVSRKPCCECMRRRMVAVVAGDCSVDSLRVACSCGVYSKDGSYFSPMWEWTFPKLDSPFLNALEPGDYADAIEAAAEGVTATTSTNAQQKLVSLHQQSVGRSSPVPGTVSRPSSPLPLSSSTQMCNNSGETTIPVVSLFNHSVNFWIMEVD